MWDHAQRGQDTGSHSATRLGRRRGRTRPGRRRGLVRGGSRVYRRRQRAGHSASGRRDCGQAEI